MPTPWCIFVEVFQQQVGLAVAFDPLDGASLVHDIVHDQLPVALVVFLDGVAFRDTLELCKQRAHGAVVHRLGDVGARDQAQFPQLGVGNVPQRHQIGARFL